MLSGSELLTLESSAQYLSTAPHPNTCNNKYSIITTILFLSNENFFGPEVSHIQ